jgi:hypothetical protein
MIPGIFLPDQIDLLAGHLSLDREQLFRKYLIAELFTPNVESTPCFVISPVKAAFDGRRLGNLLSDRGYALVRREYCIFRDKAALSCGIHEHKPFGCALLICGKMTKAKPILLNKAYYYHRWLDSQAILFSVFPELGNMYERLLDAVLNLPPQGKARTKALMRGNAIIGTEMATMMNGHSSHGKPFYRGTTLESCYDNL